MKPEVEIWKWIPGYDDYAVSNLGRIRSHKPLGSGHQINVEGRIRVLSKKKSSSGHMRVNVCLMRESKRTYPTVGYLALITFVGPRPSEYEVCHKDDNYLNNNLENLYWGTKKQNATDRVRNGKSHPGEKFSRAKLTNEEFVALGAEQGKVSDIAKKWNVHFATVYRARKGRRR